MDFGKALEAMKAGKKARRTTWNHSGKLSIGSKEQFGKELFVWYNSERNSNSYGIHPIDTSEILADDWEIIEDIPKVKIETSIEEYYVCPKCKKSNIYWPSMERDNIHACVQCGKKMELYREDKKEENGCVRDPDTYNILYGYTTDGNISSSNQNVRTFEIRIGGTWIMNIKCSQYQIEQSNIPYAFKDVRGNNIAWSSGGNGLGKMTITEQKGD